jgi:hypothetical protein
VYPHLKRQREAAEDAAFAAQIAASQRVLTMLRAEVDEMKTAQARRRLEEAKYSASQPRVPAGNPRGGQWSNRNEGGASFGSFGCGTVKRALKARAVRKTQAVQPVRKTQTAEESLIQG